MTSQHCPKTNEKETHLTQMAGDKQNLSSGHSVGYIDISMIRFAEGLQLRLAHMNSIYG